MLAYCEEEKSAALNAQETPVYAYYPMNGEEIKMVLSYCMEEKKCGDFTRGIYESYKRLSQAINDDVAELPFLLSDSINYRSISLRKSYHEFEDGEGAGFFFHFDPKKGYTSMPSGFSTSYQTIPHNTYTHILEYGFTGRQINTAYRMDFLKGGEWKEKGKRQLIFISITVLRKMVFFYSLYDLNTKKAFLPVVMKMRRSSTIFTEKKKRRTAHYQTMRRQYGLQITVSRL